MKRYLLTIVEPWESSPMECAIVRRGINFRGGSALIQVEVTPPIAGEPSGLHSDLKTLFLAARYAGDSVRPMPQGDTYVNVYRVKALNVPSEKEIDPGKLERLAIGLLQGTQCS